MRLVHPLPKGELAALVIIVLVGIGYVGAYIHDHPPGITPIADINAGKLEYGENGTIRGVIIEIRLLPMGPHDQWLTVSDGYANITLYWYNSRLEVGWAIIAIGPVHSNHELGRIQWLDRVWLFAWP